MTANREVFILNKVYLKTYLYILFPATICYAFGVEYFYLYIAIVIASVQLFFSNDFLLEHNIKFDEQIMRQSRIFITNLSISFLISKLCFSYFVYNIIDYYAQINTSNNIQLFISRSFQALLLFILALPIQIILRVIELKVAQKIKQKDNK